MARSGRSTRKNERCIFCGKSVHEVDQLIPGPSGVFICNECIDICHSLIRHEPPFGGSRHSPPLFPDEIPAPKKIVAELEKYVVGQDHAKKVLAVAVHNHYKRLWIAAKNGGQGVTVEKSNILLIGPTGCGKTHLARTLARILEVPFAIGDATSLTEAGYVGEDVENLLLRLLQAADWTLERAEQGILFVDEIDKIAKAIPNVSITRDVSGEGVQQGLLKMLEGTIANVPPQGGRKHPEQQYIQMDTSKILFICGGTFNGLEEIIARRVGKKVIGFKPTFGDQDLKDPKRRAEVLRQVDPEDVIKYGMIPEFVGRLPIICTVDPLDEEEMVKILTKPKDAIVRQYQEIFAMEDAKLTITPQAMKMIAHQAFERGTGARGLRAIIEDIMLDVMYEFPTHRHEVAEYILTPEVVRSRRFADGTIVPRHDAQRDAQRDTA